MRTVAEIDNEIERVKGELENVHGTTTEVYARIVGYYRSVRNWNRGKREEYGHRKLFVADEGRIASRLGADASCGCGDAPSVMIRSSSEAPAIMRATEDALRESAAGPAFRYELFTRKTCPNCPPVAACCEALPVSGERIDVDTEAGMIRASSYGVFSTPTVILFDADSAEIGRAHSVKEIRALTAASRAEAVLA
jgi:ribonucleoside-triphosphate reductase